MRHFIVVLHPIRSERDVIFGIGMKLDLDLASRTVLSTIREAWSKDPFSVGGDIIYLHNKNLPRNISDEDLRYYRSR